MGPVTVLYVSQGKIQGNILHENQRQSNQVERGVEQIGSWGGISKRKLCNGHSTMENI